MSLALERVPVASIRALEGNVRLHPEEQVEALAECIRSVGWLVPVLLDEGGTLLAGHGRIEAARRLGLSEVPAVRCPPGWTEERKRAFSMVDNRLAEMSSWDMDSLRVEIEYLEAFGLEFDLHGLELPPALAVPAGRGVSLRSAGSGPAEDVERDVYEVVCEHCGHRFEALL